MQVVVGVAGVEVNSAQVITADIAVTNGVVHLIDTVLLPPGLVLPGEYWFISKCIFFILKLNILSGTVSELNTFISPICDNMTVPFTISSRSNA